MIKLLLAAAICAAAFVMMDFGIPPHLFFIIAGILAACGLFGAKKRDEDEGSLPYVHSDYRGQREPERRPPPDSSHFS